jgi:hypothetical protein
MRQDRRSGARRACSPVPRWRESFLWTHLVFRASRRDYQYLDALRCSLSQGQGATLQQLGDRLGIRRQTVWQMEQRPGFSEWLSTEIHVWKEGIAWRDVDGTLHPDGVDIVLELLRRDRSRKESMRWG